MSLRLAALSTLATATFFLLSACIPVNIADGSSGTAGGAGSSGAGSGGICTPGAPECAVAALWAGGGHTCVSLPKVNRVKCWGVNKFGQLGLGDTSDRGDGPNEMGNNLPAVSIGDSLIEIAGSVDHTCARRDYDVQCWGANRFGQLGLGDTSDRGDEPNEMGNNLPVVNLGTGMKAIRVATGERHTCAVVSDGSFSGSVKCWGDNEVGQLGLGDRVRRGDEPNEMGDNLPAVDLGTGKKAVGVYVGTAHSCALLDDGTVKCWGSNGNGQLGLGDTSPRGDEPNEMGDNLPAVNLGTAKTPYALSLGKEHSCALLDNGTIKCWGANDYGQLGLGDTSPRGDEPNEMGANLPAVSVGTGRYAIVIATGELHTCAVLDGGPARNSVKCWGYNEVGMLGLGDTSSRGDEPNEMGDNLPAIDFGLGTGDTVLTISSGGFHTCALLTDSSVRCWGENHHGELGLGDTSPRGDDPNEMGANLPAVNF